MWSLLTTLGSLVSVSFALNYEPNCVNAGTCDISTFSRQIKCDTGPQFNDFTISCTCTAGTATCDDYDLVPVTAQQMSDGNGSKCEDLCKADPTCKFYRWDKEGFTSHLTCTHMDATQCGAQGASCRENSCLSGGTDCSGDDGGRPIGDSCIAVLTADVMKIQWACSDPFDRNPDILNPYTGTEVEIPHLAFCETQDRCTQFGPDAPRIVYTCTNGEWFGNVDPSTFDPPQELVDSSKQLSGEASCTPVPLSIPEDNLVEEEGVELICSDPSLMVQDGGDTGPWTISAPNSCALLCDFHHVVTIQSGWTNQPQGEVGWLFYIVGQPTPNTDFTGDNVKCW